MERETWRTPAVILACASAILAVSLGIRHGFGLFLQPMSMANGWGRETFAFAIALQNLLWGIGQPFAGAVADRYGAGRVLAAGGVLYAAGVALSIVGVALLARWLLLRLGLRAAERWVFTLAGLALMLAHAFDSLVIIRKWS